MSQKGTDGWRRLESKLPIYLLVAGCVAFLVTNHPALSEDSHAISIRSYEPAGFTSGRLQALLPDPHDPILAAEELVPAEYVERLLSSSDEVLRTAGGRLRAQANRKVCRAGAGSEAVKYDRFMARSDYLRKLRKSQLAPEEVKDIAMCIVIRNEAPRLLEWVTFHWLQGVGKFYVFDDESSDGPEVVLHKLIKLGIVELQTMPHDDISGSDELQFQKMNECYSKVQQVKDKEGIRYVTFLDTDEFMFPTEKSGETLSQLLDSHFRDKPCLSIQRSWYGSSLQHKAPKNSLTIQNFVMRSDFAEDGFPKVIINVSPELPQQAAGLYSIHAVQEDGGVQCIQDVRLIRINHYVRSLQDYDLKIQTHYTAMGRYQNNPLELWWERDRNDEFDDVAAVRYVCRIAAAMQDFQAMRVGWVR